LVCGADGRTTSFWEVLVVRTGFLGAGAPAALAVLTFMFMLLGEEATAVAESPSCTGPAYDEDVRWPLMDVGGLFGDGKEARRGRVITEDAEGRVGDGRGVLARRLLGAESDIT
jgi:hypothetical protein